MSAAEPQFLDVGTGADRRRIALRLTPGRGPTVVWLGGFNSDMMGGKATALAEWGEATGRAVVRFDYSGHGESQGRLEEGTIGRWLAESLAVIGAHGGPGPVLVGSSMGGWLALLAARALSDDARPSGLVLIAPAVDFTEELMWKRFSRRVRQGIERDGVWMRPSDYGEPYPITRALIEEGRSHLLLGAPFRVGAPVRVLQGMRDPDVPWRHTMTIVEHLAEDDVVLTLVKDGDHRLSRPEDIERLIAAVEAVVHAP
jgi:pimeloyl-ACP methyl ester carboxylesterase